MYISVLCEVCMHKALILYLFENKVKTWWQRQQQQQCVMCTARRNIFFPYVVEVCAVQGRFWADSTCTMHYISHWIIHSIMFEHSCRIC